MPCYLYARVWVVGSIATEHIQRSEVTSFRSWLFATWVLGIKLRLLRLIKCISLYPLSMLLALRDAASTSWGDSSVSMALALQAKKCELGPQIPYVNKLGVLARVWKPRAAHLSPAFVVSSGLVRDPVSRGNQINTKSPPHTHVYTSTHQRESLF